ncbi:MAG: hypothetical protein E6Q88_12410 [Lysobacteraceae bacterium]|nr:MAG: hypothetical protein E6Q88_12410 [Xanthomonadaceae bacterium]
MRSMALCLGIAAAVFAAACDKKAPPEKLLPVPQCTGVQAYDVPAFARLVAAMDRSGDIAAVTERFVQHRKTLERQLAQRDAQLPQRLKPMLDAEFSETRLRERTACLFLPLLDDRNGIAVIEAWSRDPKMQQINQSIWKRAPVAAKGKAIAMTPSRSAQMLDLANAMALGQIEANTAAVDGPSGTAALLVATLDPFFVPQPAAAAAAQPDAQVVERWLAPALAKTVDEDLRIYATFARSRFGGRYYLTLSGAQDLRTGEWYTQLIEKFKEHAAPTGPMAGQPGKEELILDARRSLREVATAAAAADARTKLLLAERYEPRNADIQALLGEAMIKTAPPMSLGPDQVRAVIETPNYESADRYLNKALALSPDHPEALLHLGRLRFLQGRDTEAAEFFARARVTEAELSALDLYEADLAFTIQDYGKAVLLYQNELSKPERLAYAHVTALARLRTALRKIGREKEYVAAAESYLANNPQAWNVRMDFAEALLTAGARADKVTTVIEPVPDDWLPVRKFSILSAALIRKSAERTSRADIPLGDSMAALQRAIKLNPDSRVLADAVCRSAVGEKPVQRVLDAHKNPRELAAALVVCGLLWRRGDIVQLAAAQADPRLLNPQLAELSGDTPLCYAAATKNTKAFSALTKTWINPAQRCNDGLPVAERLVNMAYSGDRAIEEMQAMMKRFNRKRE